MGRMTEAELRREHKKVKGHLVALTGVARTDAKPGRAALASEVGT